MQKLRISIWSNMPFFKLVIPLIAGIALQWNLQASKSTWQMVLVIGFVLFISFFFLSLFKRFQLAFIAGLAINLMIASIGALITIKDDLRNDPEWFGHADKNKSIFIVTLAEKPVEKTKSFKANAAINYLCDTVKNATVATGKMILYFDKNLFPPGLDAGAVIAFRKPLQEIKNSGNPGAFDYKRYCRFQGITHQVYLTATDYQVADVNKQGLFSKLTSSIRKKVLEILNDYIPGEKERGLAEALLIGYKDDLDKTLIQSYANTGVVHIIAISGLHLGLIYWLLLQLLKPLSRKKSIRWLQPVLIIAGLWLFSLLAGGRPSVLRAAVMFTCIILGESLDRKASVYNSLAVSAFLLLCYHPYWLWDAGFQLSYAAVLSIVIFRRPVYNWFYVRNKLLDFIWKIASVTIAAQLLTAPISIFHFQQFPVYFLLTNLVAVPLVGVILLGEILLCAVAWLPAVATFTGKLLTGMIWLMNSWIERVEALPFSVWQGMQINIVQATLLDCRYLLHCALAFGKKEKQPGSRIGCYNRLCLDQNDIIY